MFVNNEKEFGKALNDGIDTIEIEGDLAQKTIKIKATGKVAWGVCIVALGVAVAAIISAPATGGTSTAMGVVATGGVASILGSTVAVSAIMIAVSAGGVGALNKLRKYKLEKISDTKIKLTRI
ncbi:MAG: hypothetical protein LUC34_07940 [Campylobacter sp.]|nr:hypothetical protein [Campylobacter sp.]